jgi:epoxide hydrolase-like predicted phosphatase
MIRSVISDLGKVVLFFDNDIFFRKITQYSPFSLGRIKELARANFELVMDFDRGEMTPQQFYEEVIHRFKAKIAVRTFYEIYNDVFSLNQPVLETLKKLRSKYRLVLLSNTDVMRFGFVRQNFPEIFLFDAYVLSYEVGYMKPHPQIYRAALEQAGTKPQECIFIDDMEENIEGAQRLKINTILFTPQTNLEDSLRDYGLSF